MNRDATPRLTGLLLTLALACTDQTTALAPSWGDVRPLRPTSGGQLRAAARDLVIDVDARGTHLRHTQGDLDLTLSRWGRTDLALPPWGAAAPVPEACLSLPGLPACLPGAIARDEGIETWWLARQGGVEQGWTLPAPPPGEGQLLVELALRGGQARRSGDRLLLTTPHGGQWQLSGLASWDADGRALPAHIDLRGDRLRIRVDDAGAAWPVVIDPLLSSPAPLVQPSYDASAMAFGTSMARVGDSDGDGLVETLIGDPIGPDGDGAAALFGPLDEPETLLLTTPAGFECEGGRFGASATPTGDVNGDGYADLLVGQPGGGVCPPAWHLYLGDAAGLAPQPAASFTDDWAASQAADGVGDLDGDGLDDVAAVGPTGLVLLRGDPAGLVAWATLTLPISDLTGAVVRSAGDLDGDSLPDLLLGAPAHNGGGVVVRVEALASGLAPTTGAPLTAPAGSVAFGASLAVAPDTNVDGRPDVIVGDPGANGGVGKAWVFLGGPAGLQPTPAPLQPPAGAAMGTALAVSDLDNNGLSDVAVAGSAGTLLVFKGTFEGAGPSPSGCTDCFVGYGAVLGVDDADNDGLGDLLAADPAIGAAHLHRGCIDDDLDGWCADVDCADLDASRHPEAEEIPGDGVDADCDGAELCLRDLDGDGWASQADPFIVSSDTDCADPGEARDDVPAFDCADNDAQINPLAAELVASGVDENCDTAEVCWADADLDGFRTDGFVASPDLDCEDPGEAVELTPAGDCDDGDADANPGETEVPANGRDEDCDSFELCATDADDDGFSVDVPRLSADLDCADPGEATPADPDGDCDDTRAGVNPGAPEQPVNGRDDDCDGAEACYQDGDRDGWLGPLGTVASLDLDCEDPGESPFSGIAGDCDDGDDTISPAGTELVADGVDQDCDGGDACRLDGDRDGFRTDTIVPSADLDCADPGETNDATPAGDCADADGTIFPGATERPADGIDQDCNSFELCGTDADEDGYRSNAPFQSADLDCTDPGEATPADPGGDCDDARADVNPGAMEGVANGRDNDCDGEELCFHDADQDGWLAAGGPTLASADLDCDDPGESSVGGGLGDCADANPAVNPGQVELVADGTDQDCDGAEACWQDVDRDGFRAALSILSADLDCRDPGEADGTTLEGDCDDAADTIRPDALDTTGDGIDSNCDGAETCWADGDGDGFRTDVAITSADLDCFDRGEADAFALGGDCDDTSPLIRPGAPDTTADQVDSDCDGVELCFRDEDADGWLSAAAPTIPSSDADCTDPGEALGGTAGDCGDTDPAVHPDATELVANGVDESCDGAETCWADLDRDGFRTDATVRSADLDCTDPGEATTDVLNTDCDDADPTILPGGTDLTGDGVDGDCDGAETCWADADEDGFRGEGVVPSADADCFDAGEATDALPPGDCDDALASTSPVAAELTADGVDNDCDGAEQCFQDVDADGWLSLLAPTLISEDLDCADPGEAAVGEPGDCDDAVVDVHPEAPELLANGVDEDCTGGDACWPDADLDGFRGEGSVTSADLDCLDPGEATEAMPDGDCHDRDDATFPGATDTVGDGLDSDCDGAELCWVDLDDDGVRAIAPALSDDVACDGLGEVSVLLPGGDCDDLSATTFPGAAELPGDAIDGDCNGTELCFIDLDGDGWLPRGAPAVRSEDIDCSSPGEASSADQLGDCADEDPAISPGVPDIPDNGIDEDCDGVDSCWFDSDEDGFRTALPGPGNDLDCDDPGEVPEATPDGDCDDATSATYPGAPEIEGDGIDSACDGNELCFVDLDDDGYLADSPATVLSTDGDCADPGEAPPGTPFGDCNDGAAEINPGVDDVPGSRVDEDCDGLKSCLQDADDDGYTVARAVGLPANDADCDDPNEAWADDPSGDCRDDEAAAYPGAVEIPNSALDEDCNGEELCRLDADDDGFYNLADTPQGSQDLRCRGAGLASANALPGDCDDNDRDLNPFEDDEPDDQIDQDCDGFDTCYADLDGDGYRARQDGTVPSEDFDCDDPGEATQSAPRNDCDDLIAEVYPNAPEIAGNLRDEDCNGAELCLDDDDGDGFIDTSGDSRTSTDMDCRDPNEADLQTPATDCDDARPDIKPGGRELRADNIDGDCDGRELCLIDGDDDGFLVPDAAEMLSDDVDCDDAFEGALVDPITDCDDADATRNPDAPEVPANGLDEDCDDADACYDDDDGDGFLDASGDIRPGDDYDCGGPNEGDAFSPTTDCDDNDAADNPDAIEIIGNGDDEDCDGQEICLDDDDDDGYLDTSGDTRQSTDRDCRDPFEGLATDPTTDCDDADAERVPGGEETPGDGIDGDCDGGELCYVDGDNDGHGELSGRTIPTADGDCNDRGEASATDPLDDCDDEDPDRYPGADEEVGDEIDGDCDGAEICYLDADADRVLDGNALTRPSQDTDCRDQYEGSLQTPVGDCNDAERTIRPGAPDANADGVDANCDGAESCYVDSDGDGFRTDVLLPGNDDDCTDPGEALASVPAGDCDDRNASVNPEAVDTPGDGRDANCDGGDPCYADADNDGWRTEDPAEGAPDGDCDDDGEARRNEPTGDCDDNDADIRPGVDDEIGDNVDQDCDGRERCRVDADDDDWTTDAILLSDDADCDDPGESPSASVSPDCDDADAAINPGRVEIPADSVDQNCDGRELCYEDLDDDGWRTSLSIPSADGDCDDPGEASADLPEGDCADGKAEVHPEAVEIVASGQDEDCDGDELCYVDIDGDGFRASDDATIESRDATCDGLIEASAASPIGDCDDTTTWINPAAFEVLLDGIDQDCDGLEDDVPEGSKEKKTFLGISCASTGSTPVGPLAGLLLAVAGLRRRRT